MGTSLLFAYGTLMPADAHSAARGGWEKDAVRGRLFDLGPYPALVQIGDPQAGWVEGFIRSVDLACLEGPLDSWEEVAAGKYCRVHTRTRGGKLAWVYVYARPLPPDARGLPDRWLGRRGVWPHDAEPDS
jgi:gamma-glutamylcyclotransferase (GGCT)/AIG2-like uncharacterized protein YtfP